MDKENVDSDRCAISINSIACLNVCRRDLFRLRDRTLISHPHAPIL
jgi:hypothetical protein